MVITSVARSRKVHDKKMINQYEFQESLGRGQHGEVSIAKDTVTGDIVVSRVLVFSALRSAVAGVLQSQPLNVTFV